ncbi:MAG: molybdopterin-guanine dinucleotide biosynthesis protein B [Candidatus Reconcilbacillus cellulovorans]|uniref:Molybdopterin-guanine dinucleotide biosynthesis protein B n=1 Tax=Candidatus Reconcilbacillus cellulovorans TaxID=1906605 RepID=A0A2A6E425_9BACL|nr:MAG: molybdopterin-guanine dinucleotide biosynthesis protein B [Candidatus Reconcilbacillus cellulovorans]
MRVFQVVGYHNAGKTTLVCRLIERLQAAGYRVGVVKHDAHGFEVDREGKDTWRHRRAGADPVAIVSKTGTAWMSFRPLSLAELLARMDGADVVLVEGFKEEAYPKIVVVRSPDDWELAGRLRGVMAVAAWPEALGNRSGVECPVFSADDVEEIFGRLVAGMKDAGSCGRFEREEGRPHEG